jgi:uncharacterized protein
MLNFIRKQSLLFFILLTLLISWLPWYTGGKGIFVFGPSIAGVITIAMTTGKDGLRELMKRALKWKVGFKWWLIALFLPALLTLFALGINLLVGANMPPFTFFKKEWYLLPVFFSITLVGGPLGEEFGWRGFALPHLQKFNSPWMASVILGLMWGLWHIPQFFNPDAVHYELGLGRIPLYVLAEVGLATLMTWVYNKTNDSLLVGGLIYHNADNFWGVVLLTSTTMTAALGGESAGVDLVFWTISAGITLLAALIVSIATKGRLGKAD